MSIKCPQCDLVNWDYDEFCRRCKASLNPAFAPPVFKWYIAYCVTMALMYLGCAALGVALFFVEPDADMSEAEAKVMASVFLVMGLAFFVVYGVGPFVGRRSWGWIYGIVLIAIGLTSFCCLPVSLPLLIFWLKPDVKAFYGRTESPPGPPPPPPQWT